MLQNIIIASLGVSAISFSGALLLWRQVWNRMSTNMLVSFAAGVMLTGALLDLFPEAIEEAPEGAAVFLPALVGIVVFFFLERFVVWFHHHHETHGNKPSTILLLVGDGIHNIIDGVAIAAAFLTNPGLGLATTIAIAAHEIPQEIADFSILVSGGFSKTKALLWNFISGLTALLGAIGAYFFLSHIEGVLWIFLSFSAGMFLYIACSDLIPELHEKFAEKKQWKQSLPFLAGIILMWLFIFVLEG